MSSSSSSADLVHTDFSKLVKMLKLVISVLTLAACSAVSIPSAPQVPAGLTPQQCPNYPYCSIANPAVAYYGAPNAQVSIEGIPSNLIKQGNYFSLNLDATRISYDPQVIPGFNPNPPTTTRPPTTYYAPDPTANAGRYLTQAASTYNPGRGQVSYTPPAPASYTPPAPASYTPPAPVYRPVTPSPPTVYNLPLDRKPAAPPANYRNSLHGTQNKYPADVTPDTCPNYPFC